MSLWTYGDFIGRLKDTTEKQVKGEQIQELLLKELGLMPVKIAKD